MAGLYFKIGADFDNLKRLKKDIEDLKVKLSGMDKAADPKAFNKLDKELTKLQQEFNSTAEAAAKAGHKFENDFKQKIYEISSTVNELSRKIIDQKSVVQSVKTDVDQLTESYRKLSKTDPRKKNDLSELNSEKKVLIEEKNALFDLQQQQSQARLSTKELTDEYKRYYNTSTEASGGTDMFTASVKKMLMKVGGTAAIIKLGKDIISTHSNFQQLEIAFGTMLKSGEKAKDLIGDLADFSARTPFGMESAAAAAKQLIAYGSAADSVIGELTMLGDVAAGTGQSIGDIVYLYGTLRMQGRAYLMDIRQFAGRGIPIYKELANVLGVAEGQVNDLVSAGKVGFKEVEQAFKNMTSSGGMYGGLMEKQSKALAGQIEALKDNIQMMFNEIGEQSEGVVGGAINTAALLVENYDKVGKILLLLIGTYGYYKTAVIVNTVANRGLSASYIALKTRILETQKAQELLNSTLLKNPYIIAGTFMVGALAAIWALHDGTTEAEKAQRHFSDSVAESKKNANAEQRELTRLSSELNNATRGTKEFNSIKNEIVNKFGKYREGLDEEIERVGSLDVLYKSLAKSIQESFAARQYDKFQKEQSDYLDNVMSNNLGKIQDRLIKELGETSGSEYYAKIRDAIFKGEDFSQDVVDVINKVQDKGTLAADSRLDGYIKNIKEAQKATDEFDKKAKQRFGITGQDSSESGGTPSEEIKAIYGADYQAAQKTWNEAKAKLGEISKDRNKFTTEEYKKAKEDAETAKKAFEELGGVTSFKADDSEAKKLIEQRKKIYDELLKLQSDNIASGISLMEDGYDKRMAQIDHDYNEEIAALNAKMQEWKDAQGGQLTVEQTTAYDDAYNKAFEKRIKAEQKLNEDIAKSEKQSWIDYNKEYGDYQAKRIAITEDYAKKIAEAQTAGEKASLQKEQEKALQDLDQSMIEKSDLWVRLFEDADNQTNGFINKIINETQQLLDYLNGVEGVTIPFGFTDEQLEALKSDPEKIKAIWGVLIKKRDELNKRNPFGQLIKGFKGLKAASTDANKQLAFSDISQGIQGVSSIVGDLGTTMKSVFGEGASEDIDSITKSIQGLMGIGSGAAKLFAGDLTGIADILQGLPSLIDGIGGLFGGNDDAKLQTQIDRYEKMIGLYDQLIDKQKEYLSTLTGADAKKQADEIESMIERQLVAQQKALDAWSQSGKSKGFLGIGSSHSKGYEFIRSLGGQLGIKSISDLFDWDASQWEGLQKNVELWEQLPDEVAAYGQAVIDAKDSTKDLGEVLRESITGISFNTLKDSLDDIVTVADISFADVADSFEDHMSKAVMNVIKKTFLDEALMNWYKNLEDAMNDGTLSEGEVDGLRKEYEDAAKKANEKFKSAMDIAGIDITDNKSSDNSLAGAYSKASQESIDLLAGQTGAARVVLEDIRRMMGGIGMIDQSQYYAAIQNSMQVIRDLQVNGWKEVTLIRELSQQVANNTAELNRISNNIAESNAAISANTKETSKALNGRLEVKVVGTTP